MPEYKYLCYFETWSGFMDGDLTHPDGTIEMYDFVDSDNKDSDKDIVLNPFTEDSARQHFADKGITNIKFIYAQE